jgi:hypothetical protein
MHVETLGPQRTTPKEHRSHGHGGGTHWVMAGYDFPLADNGPTMIYLPGGPSPLNRYDLKPDAPEELRCQHFPLQARRWDEPPEANRVTSQNLRERGAAALGAVCYPERHEAGVAGHL